MCLYQLNTERSPSGSSYGPPLHRRPRTQISTVTGLGTLATPLCTWQHLTQPASPPLPLSSKANQRRTSTAFARLPFQPRLASPHISNTHPIPDGSLIRCLTACQPLNLSTSQPLDLSSCSFALALGPPLHMTCCPWWWMAANRALPCLGLTPCIRISSETPSAHLGLSSPTTTTTTPPPLTQGKMHSLPRTSAL